jgi:hypothetical protein
LDLQEFIHETISASVRATSNLQVDLEHLGVAVNSPVSSYESERGFFEDGGAGHTLRRIEIGEFDVAVTAASETAGGGKAGLKFFAAEAGAGAEGRHGRRNEEVSPVRFSVPIALPPSNAERTNRAAREQRNRHRTD